MHINPWVKAQKWSEFSSKVFLVYFKSGPSLLVPILTSEIFGDLSLSGKQ